MGHSGLTTASWCAMVIEPIILAVMLWATGLLLGLVQRCGHAKKKNGTLQKDCDKDDEIFVSSSKACTDPDGKTGPGLISRMLI